MDQQDLPVIYEELRRRAEAYLRSERADHTLQPTALVHEAYLKLADRPGFNDRTHFLASAAKAMREILVDHARRRLTERRGGDRQRVSFDPTIRPGRDGDVDLLGLDAALSDLARLDARKAQVVELRFFGGMTIEETAATLGVSHMTVSNDWRAARAWLGSQLSDDPADPAAG